MARLGTGSVGLRAPDFLTTRAIICFVSRRLVVAQAGEVQHAGRSFEVVLFCTTLSGQTKIQHDTMQNRRTLVLGSTALPLYLRYLEDTLFSVPFWRRYRHAQYLPVPKIQPANCSFPKFEVNRLF